MREESVSQQNPDERERCRMKNRRRANIVHPWMNNHFTIWCISITQAIDGMMVLLQLQQSPIWSQSYRSIRIGGFSTDFVFEEKKKNHFFRTTPPKLANLNKFVACAYAIKMFSQLKKVRRIQEFLAEKNVLSTFVTLISIYHHLVTKIGASTAAFSMKHKTRQCENNDFNRTKIVFTIIAR